MSEPISTAPTPSQADPSAAAGQAAAAPQTTTQQPQAETAPKLDAKSLLEASRFELSPAEKLAKLERDYSASSSEARRLKGVSDALTKALNEQGLKPEFDAKGNFKGLSPDDKYEHEVPKVRFPKLSDLSKSERDLFSEDPEKALEAYQARVGESLKAAFVRAKATIDPQPKLPDPPDAARIKSTVDFVVGLKLPNGADRYENGRDIAPVLEQELMNPSLSESFRELLAKDPNTAIGLMADRLQLSVYRMKANGAQQTQQTQQKTAEAQRVASLQPNGEGRVIIGNGTKEAAAAEFLKGMNNSMLPPGARS